MMENVKPDNKYIPKLWKRTGLVGNEERITDEHGNTVALVCAHDEQWKNADFIAFLPVLLNENKAHKAILTSNTKIIRDQIQKIKKLEEENRELKESIKKALQYHDAVGLAMSILKQALEKTDERQ